MTDWIRNQKAFGTPEHLGVIQLAWLGDAVWELHQRLRHCDRPGRSKDLHIAVVSEVKADAQAIALKTLEPYLSDSEKNMVRKGRNKSSTRSNKSDPAIYAKATGFETMIGWLFLKNPARLAQLLDRLDESKSDLQ